MAKKTAGRWAWSGVYEPKLDFSTSAMWERYLKELEAVEFKPGVVPTKEHMVAQARQNIAFLKNLEAGDKKTD